MLTQLTLPAIEQFFHRSSDAVLLGSMQPDYGQPAFLPTYINPAAQTLLAISPDSDGILSLLGSHQWPALRKSIHKIILNPSHPTATVWLNDAQNGPKEVSFDITCFESRLIVRLREEKPAIAQVHQELANKALQLQGVFDASPCGLILLEAIRDEAGQVMDFRYLLANEMASRINGVPLDQLIGNTLLTLFPTSRTTGSFPQNVRALETETPVRKQLRLSCDRMEGWYEFVSNPINQNLLVVSFIDITDTKQLEERQSKLLDELKRSNQNLQQFAYIASHDLQEPLRKIQSFGEVLTNQYAAGLGEGGADLIQRMQSAATRMSVLIRDLLTYSRLSTQQEPYQPVALDSLINDVLDDLELAIKESQTQISRGTLPILTGNKTQLRQLMQNLIANAIKFRKPDAPSCIQITYNQLTGNELPSCLDPTQSYYEICIADEGIGFDPAYSDKIFQMFQRLHGRSQYEGTGMGLAICRKVAENHGGTVTASSQLQAGSIFRVYLPVTPTESMSLSPC